MISDSLADRLMETVAGSAQQNELDQAFPGPCGADSLSKTLVVQSLRCIEQLVSDSDRQRLYRVAHRSDNGHGTPIPTLNWPGLRPYRVLQMEPVPVVFQLGLKGLLLILALITSFEDSRSLNSLVDKTVERIGTDSPAKPHTT
jgi:hypothetical protein